MPKICVSFVNNTRSHFVRVTSPLYVLAFDFGGLIFGRCLCVVKKQKTTKKEKTQKTTKKGKNKGVGWRKEQCWGCDCVFHLSFDF